MILGRALEQGGDVVAGLIESVAAGERIREGYSTAPDEACVPDHIPDALVRTNRPPTRGLSADPDGLIRLTSANEDLTKSDRVSMLGNLRWLKQESIRQAGLRFCKALGEVEF